MDCPNKNCKYYKKKEKALYFIGCDMSGGGYCTKGYCEKQFRRKRKQVRYGIKSWNESYYCEQSASC